VVSCWALRDLDLHDLLVYSLCIIYSVVVEESTSGVKVDDDSEAEIHS
jgi:hypothetical protein